MNKFNSMVLVILVGTLWSEVSHCNLKHGLRSYKEPRHSDALSLDSLAELSEGKFIRRNIYDLIFNSHDAEQIIGYLVNEETFLDRISNTDRHYRVLLNKAELYMFDPYFQQAVKNVAQKMTFKYLLPHDMNLDSFSSDTVEYLRSVIIKRVHIKHNDFNKNVTERAKPEQIEEAGKFLNKLFKEYHTILASEKLQAPERVNTARNRAFATIKDAINRVQRYFPNADSLEFEFSIENLAPKLKVYPGSEKNGFSKIDDRYIEISQFEAPFLRILFFPQTKLTPGDRQKGYIKISVLKDFLNNNMVLGDLRKEFNKTLVK